MIPPFSMVAPLVAYDGYGQSAERLILAATDAGADINFIAYDWQERQWADPELLALEVPEHHIGLRELVVIYFLPFAVGRFAPQARQAVLMTMFETDSIPLSWIGPCNGTDGLIVPSEHCREAFQPNLRVPVEVAPLGVDTGFYEFVPRPADRTCTFLMTGLLHYRKGAEFAVEAFRQEFGPADDVRLILKTRKGFLDVGDADLRDPRIEVINADYSRQQMRALYGRCDCFLAPSRGEASGLTPREAMATGLPTVVTDWGGLREIADSRYAWPVEPECLEPAPPECSSYSAGVAGRNPIGNFARPSVPGLRRAMREIHDDREAAYRRAAAGALWMTTRWSWRRCAREWLDALARLTT